MVRTPCFPCQGCGFDSWLGSCKILQAMQPGQIFKKLKRILEYSRNNDESLKSIPWAITESDLHS